MRGAHAAGLLSALALAAPFSLRAAPDYLVSGIVVDLRSRAPLAHARVSLAPTTARDQKLEQVTKPDGRFAFPVGHGGKYELRITKPGYPPQIYKQAGLSGVSSAIVVRDDQDTTHIVFEANRGSVITGQIKDEDSEPVANALVAIFQSLVVGGERRVVTRGMTRANAAGQFRFANLTSGNYYICAMGRPWFADSLIGYQAMQEVTSTERGESPLRYSPDPGFRGTAFLTTFYPRAQNADEAALVRLDAGAESHVTITLPLAKAVSVKAAISLPGEIGGGRAVLLKKIYDQYMPFLYVVVQKGTAEFDNVPAGSYEIKATSESGAGASSWNVQQEVEVGVSDMEVTLRPSQMGSLAGRVLFEGERPASMPNLFVSLHNEKGQLLRAGLSAEGTYSFSRMLPGRWEVTANSTDYVAAFLMNSTGDHLPLTLEIASGETATRDLMLTRAVSVIEGTVENAGLPQIGAFVLLMPKDLSRRWAYRMDQTDSDGSYHLLAIPSGDYFLIALTSGEDVVYRDAKVAAALTKAAKPVHIEPGDHLDLHVDVVSTATLIHTVERP